MNVGDWIKDLLSNLKVDIKLPKKILNNIKVNILAGKNNSLVTIHKRENINTYNIYLGSLSIDQKKDILKDLPKIVDSGTPILETESVNKAEDYLKKIQEKESQELLVYFQDKLPPGDILILKSSLYLKSVLKNGGDTIALKNDISQKFGPRGRNISNLCTAGYFSTFIKKLYESIATRTDFRIEDFWTEYNFIIDIFPFAVFINTAMSEKDVKDAISEKIKSSQKYSLHYLNIHGIGNSNISKIQSAFSELEKKIKFTDKSINIEKGIIVIKVEF